MWELSFSVAFSSSYVLVFAPRVPMGPAAEAPHPQCWWWAHRSPTWMWKRGFFFFNCVLTRGRTAGGAGADGGSGGKCCGLGALPEIRRSHNRSWHFQPQERYFHLIFFLWAKPWGLYSVSAPLLLSCQSKSVWLELSKSGELVPVLAEAPLVLGGDSSDSSHCRAQFLLWFRWAPETSVPLSPQTTLEQSPRCRGAEERGFALPPPDAEREATPFAAGTRAKLQDF